ncbi:MAG: roadblock/LC7 domain-containing protein [Deltaproteobacteria bacterium]|nr:roadblock/LC7 domain-containing protein [Deltaproteobacteria bacterium]
MFGELLSEVVKGVDGAIGVVLMGTDGLPVDQVVGDPPRGDIEAMAMELSVVLREIKKAASQLGAGQAEEVMIRGATMTTVIRVLNEDYFVALALPPTASIGKGRYLLRRVAPRLRENL